MSVRKVAIVGCRPADNDSSGWDLWVRIAMDVEAFVVSLPLGVIVISGGARGVDSRAVKTAKAIGREVVEYLPDYEAHGSRAPLVRNGFIVAEANEIHAWPAPWSRGTWDTVRKAKASGKPVTIHRVE